MIIIIITIIMDGWKKDDLPRSEQWYQHTAESVIQTKKVTILSDVSIYIG